MKKVIYLCTGLLLGLIVGYFFNLLAALIFIALTEVVKSGWLAALSRVVINGWVLLICMAVFGLVGARGGYRLATENYQFKNWQIGLAVLTFFLGHNLWVLVMV